MPTASRFKPDPHIEPIVVRSVVLRPVGKEYMKVGKRAHVTLLIYPKCQVALLACGEHLPFGGPKASYSLTDERWLSDLLRVPQGRSGGPCKSCLRRVTTPADNPEQYEAIKELKEDNERRGIVPPAWQVLRLNPPERIPLRVHPDTHPFWMAVRLWQARLNREFPWD